jgi:heme A synthase
MKNIRSLRRYSFFTLIVSILVILWGAYVRATGAGAGCGKHWPLCNGEVIPRAPAVETIVEFTHRISSGVAFLLVLGLLIWVLRTFHAGHLARIFAGLAMGSMIIEALIGAGLVLFELVAFNSSATRAVIGALHLLNTFVLLGSIMAVIENLELKSPTVFELYSTRGLLLMLGMVGIILVGMSGAIAALGDTLFPSSTLIEGIRQDFNANAHFLLRLRIWHPVIALLASLSILIGIRLPPPGEMRAPQLQMVLTLLILTQLLAGLINVLLLAPVWLQILHLLLADLIWLGLIVTIFRTQRLHETA